MHEEAAAPSFFIPLKFSGREPLGEQENLQTVESEGTSDLIFLPQQRKV